MAELRIFALLTDQGTAASETMLCEDDTRVVPAVLMVLDAAASDGLACTSDDNGNHQGETCPIHEATFEDVTDNDEAACRWCGRDSRGLTG